MEEAISLNGRSTPPFVTALTAFGTNIVSATPTEPPQCTNWPANPNAMQSFDPATALPTGGAPITPQGVPNNLATPITYRCSLLTQYDMGHQWVLTVGYQGSLSRHYTRRQFPNLFSTSLHPLNPAVQQLTCTPTT